jgi:hypothetical protein
MNKIRAPQIRMNAESPGSNAGHRVSKVWKWTDSLLPRLCSASRSYSQEIVPSAKVVIKSVPRGFRTGSASVAPGDRPP